jgi:hypothetical protein
MKKILLLFIILNTCRTDIEDNRIVSALLLRRLSLLTAENVSFTGQVRGPGSVKNARVEVVAAPSSGSCVDDSGKTVGTILGTSFSDSAGKYAITYRRANRNVCIVITPEEGKSRMEVFQPTNGSRRDSTWIGSNNLLAVVAEPSARGVITPNRNVNVTPFTRMASRRFFALSGTNSNSRHLKSIFLGLDPFGASVRSEAGDKKVKFGKNGVATILDKAYEDVSNSFFPREGASFSLTEADPSSRTFALRLGAIGTLADRLGGANDGNVGASDFEKVINYMEEDFSDGRFDGKKIDPNTNRIATMSTDELGGVVSSNSGAKDFLTDEFKSATQAYDAADPTLSGTSNDLGFCDSDSLEANCELAFVPGSPQEAWVFDPDENFMEEGSSFDFDRVGFGTGGSSATRFFTIVNAGGTDLVISNVSISSARFTINTAIPYETTIAPGDATYLPVMFTPNATGTVTSTMTITTNDTVYTPITVTLSGIGENLSSNVELVLNFTSGSLNDTSGNTRNASNNSPANVTSIPDLFEINNRAYYFNGNNNAFMTTTGTALPSFSTGFVGSVVVNLDQINDPSYYIFLKGTNTNPDFELYFTNYNSDKATIDLVLKANTNVEEKEVTHTLEEEEFGSWDAIVVAYNGSTLRLFFNGELVDSIAQTGSLETNGNSLRIGASDVANTSFVGGIDQIKLFSTNLTNNQITALSNQD